MSEQSYSISQLASDLEQVCARFKDDRQIISAVHAGHFCGELVTPPGSSAS